MTGGDTLIQAIRLLTLLALLIGIGSVSCLLWVRRDTLFRPRVNKERELYFGAATEVLEKVILDFTYVNTHQEVDNQTELASMADRLKKYAARPFLGSDLRIEMNRLKLLVETKLNTAVQEFPLGESAWPENGVQWGRGDVPIIDQYLVLLEKTADQLQVNPASFREIKDYLLGVKQKLDRIVILSS